jgi:phosphatidate phosphatase APP1
MLAAVLLTECSLISPGAGGLSGQPRAVLQGYDLAALPGEKVVLRAKLEADAPLLLRKDLEGRLVYFTRGRRLLGRAVTDNQGWADAEYAVPKDARGNLRVTCRLDENDEYLADPCVILVAVREKDAPILVVDVDHTIADVSAIGFLVKSSRSVKPLPGSPEVLGRLAKRFTIIYLTHRDDAFMRVTKQWLQMKGFPEGPVLFGDIGGKPLSSEKHKKERLGKLCKKFDNLVCGIGDKSGDARAYLASNMRAVIVGGKRPKDLPEEAEFVRSWAEIEKLFE